MDDQRRTAIRRLAISSGVVAAAFVLNSVLLLLPNVEVLTLGFFFVGYLFGPAWGALVGAIGEGVYSGFNPFGAAPLPVLAAQIASMALAGVLGGLTRRLLDNADRNCLRRRILPVAFGIIATLLFDLLTNLATALMGPFEATLLAVMIAGAPFAAVHLAANALLFALGFPILVRLARQQALV